MLKKILIAAILIVVCGLAALFIMRNILVERAVEVGSEYSLGVKTDLGAARVELGGGSLELQDMEIANPEGFSGDHFMTMHRAMLDVDIGLVMEDLVPVDSFVIEGVALRLEQIDGKGNYQTILNHIKSVVGGPSESDAPRFKFGLIAIRDVEVSAALTLLGQSPVEKSYKVERIVLRDVGAGDGVTISQVTGKIIQTLVTKGLAAGHGVLPAGFGQNLSDLADEQKAKAEEAAKQQVESAVKSLLGGKK